MTRGNENKLFHAAFEGDQITIFTVTSWSPWLLVKKGLLYLDGDVTLEVYTVQGEVLFLSQSTLECQMPVSTWTTMGHQSLVGRGIV